MSWPTILGSYSVQSGSFTELGDDAQSLENYTFDVELLHDAFYVNNPNSNIHWSPTPDEPPTGTSVEEFGLTVEELDSILQNVGNSFRGNNDSIGDGEEVTITVGGASINLEYQSKPIFTSNPLGVSGPYLIYSFEEDSSLVKSVSEGTVYYSPARTQNDINGLLGSGYGITGDEGASVGAHFPIYQITAYPPSP